MLQPNTIRFLQNLQKNNNKPWFESHREDYEAAKNDFEDFINSVIVRYAPQDDDLAGLVAKQCMFRINRDVRFSKNKSPYKSNMGASLSRGGKKSPFAGYYIHIEPGKSFVGGGIWMPEPADVKKIRQEIDYCFKEFSDIITSKKFVGVYKDLDRSAEYSLVNTPKEYEKDNPAAADLKLKSWIAIRPVTDEELASKDLLKKVTLSFGALQPLLRFINRSIE